MFAVVEGGDAPHDLPGGVAGDPADRLPVGEQLVAAGIEDGPDVAVERADPVAVAPVYFLRQVEPLPLQSRGDDLLQDVLV